MKTIQKVTFLLTLMIFIASVSNTGLAIDLNETRGWITVGIPNYIHIGTQGEFYLNGTNHGTCSGVQPRYFRVDTSAPHFKEFWAWLLLAATKDITIDCVVQSGCGTAQIWVQYCRGALR